MCCMYILGIHIEPHMDTTIQKWGNSFAVRIPKELVRKRKLVEGSRVTVSEHDSAIVIRRVVSHAPSSLAGLVKGITPDTLHHEVSWDTPTGNEVW